jgi:hypothetical protein
MLRVFCKGYESQRGTAKATVLFLLQVRPRSPVCPSYRGAPGEHVNRKIADDAKIHRSRCQANVTYGMHIVIVGILVTAQ